jgi:hypothetical protein
MAITTPRVVILAVLLLLVLPCQCKHKIAGSAHLTQLRSRVAWSTSSSRVLLNPSDSIQLDALKTMMVFAPGSEPPCYNVTTLDRFCGVSLITNRTCGYNIDYNSTCFSFDTARIPGWPLRCGLALDYFMRSMTGLLSLRIDSAAVTLDFKYLLPVLEELEIVDSILKPFASSSDANTGAQHLGLISTDMRLFTMPRNRFTLRNTSGWLGMFWMASLRDTTTVDLSHNPTLAGAVIDPGYLGSVTTDGRPRTIDLRGSNVSAVVVGTDEATSWVRQNSTTDVMPGLYIDADTQVLALYTGPPVDVRRGWFCADAEVSMAAHFGAEHGTASASLPCDFKIIANDTALNETLGVEYIQEAGPCVFNRDAQSGYVHSSADWAATIHSVDFRMVFQRGEGSLELVRLDSGMPAPTTLLAACPPQLTCHNPRGPCLNYTLIVDVGTTAAQISPVKDGVYATVYTDGSARGQANRTNSRTCRSSFSPGSLWRRTRTTAIVTW